ncbi:hypothetical protein WME76_45185 (plasmid) [Sorangium sp. So ce119]|uniref:hypothetical protein n=1 Tax=Sorangium sp. So ce119 TaxID=3133279 RepID=UPI003F60EE3C
MAKNRAPQQPANRPPAAQQPRPRKKHVPSKKAKNRATELAWRMPLVHYPASVGFDTWTGWDGLKSRVALGMAHDPGKFGELRGKHVFVYGGPCCYYRNGCVGDAVIYFDPGAEAGKDGSATPFDSGSLEDSPPKLQPFRSQGADAGVCWRFFEQHEVPLDTWRARFERWLAHAYDDPDRYLDTQPDRYAAGQPDRLKPAALLKHNGTRGRARYGPGECGDRRTWTWEVRIAAELSFEKIALLHVPFDALQRALDAADRLRFRGGTTPAVETLPRGEPGSYRSLYEHSGEVLRRLLR